MRIDNVELRNIGPHRHLLVSFGKGLIGLVGSNGAGKSTLVNSIYAALTNDFSRFGNAKSEIITNGATDSSYIKITGRHVNQPFELIRWLRPNKSEFTLGTQSFSKATDVNEAIVSQLNIPKILIDKYVFVNQWEMFSFIDQSAAERAKTFQYLCGTEAAAQVYKVCHDFVTRQEAVQVIDNSLELTEALRETTRQVKMYRQRVATATESMLDSDTIQSHRQLVKSMDAADAAEAALSRETDAASKAEIEVTSGNQQLERLDSKLSARVNWQTANADDIEKANKLLEAYAEYEQQTLSRQKVARIKQETERLLRSLVCPDQDTDSYCLPVNRDNLVGRVSALRVLVNQVKGLELGSDDCPHCGQELTEEYRQKVQAELKRNQVELVAAEQRLTYSKEYDAKVAAFVQKKGELSRKVEAATERIAELDAALAVYGTWDKDSAELLVSKNLQVQQQIDELMCRIAKVKLARDEAAGQFKAAERYIAKYRQEVLGKPAQSDYDSAINELQAHEEASLARQEAVGAYKAAKEAQTKTAEMLVTLKDRLAKQLKIRNLITTVQEAAEIFHWSHLPKAVAQQNLGLLISDINQNLDLFNHPFVVEADDDLTLKVIFPGQLPVKAKQLSGGQKVILAIAFRSALDRVFGCDTGMLFLDEPTAGLDVDNLSYFHTALQTLAQRVGDKQLVVITHVSEFKEIFDQVIEITRT